GVQGGSGGEKPGARKVMSLLIQGPWRTTNAAQTSTQVTFLERPADERNARLARLGTGPGALSHVRRAGVSGAATNWTGVSSRSRRSSRRRRFRSPKQRSG